jgi:aminoglycoside/choline kinase family phosphotransferase
MLISFFSPVPWSETEQQARCLSEDSSSSTVVNMERRYGNEEYADMHFMCGKANGNALEAARLYQEAFPHRRQPDSRTFTRVHQRLREQGASQLEDEQVGPKA